MIRLIQPPSAAICVIGTEISRGIIQDGHVRLIASELTSLGCVVREARMVPDDERVRDVLKAIAGTVDILITTGGLGPTSDDMTRFAVAEAAGVELVQDSLALNRLRERLGREPNAANLRQVWFPRGFSFMENPVGTAPGFYGRIQPDGDAAAVPTLVISLPGPPNELQVMFSNIVIPLLQNEFHVELDSGREELSVFLVPESQLEEACRAVVLPGVLWGTRVQPLKISLYLSALSGADRAVSIARLRERLGAELLTEGDAMPGDSLVSLLKARKIMVAGVESCTGGYVSKLLTDLPGSSAYYWGTAVAYANEAKMTMADLPEKILQDSGAVSKEAALCLARNIRIISGVAAGFSVTGVAGPDGGTAARPAGTVWFGFSGEGRQDSAVQLRFHAYSRDSVRKRAAAAVLILLNMYLRGESLDRVGGWQYI